MTETETQILDMLQVGRSRDVIIAKVRPAGWSTFDVQQFAEQRGYVFDSEGCPRTTAKVQAAKPRAELDPETIAPKPAFVPSQTPAAPVSPAPVRRETPLEDADSLIRACTDHRVRKVATAAARAAEALQTLRAVVAEQDAAAEAQAEAARARAAAAAAEVERLEQQLRDARARLRSGAGPVVPARTKPEALSGAKGAGLDPKVVRAWAAAEGIPCNQVGRIQTAVVQQYLAAKAAGRC